MLSNRGITDPQPREQDSCKEQESLLVEFLDAFRAFFCWKSYMLTCALYYASI